MQSEHFFQSEQLALLKSRDNAYCVGLSLRSRCYAHILYQMSFSANFKLLVANTVSHEVNCSQIPQCHIHTMLCTHLIFVVFLHDGIMLYFQPAIVKHCNV